MFNPRSIAAASACLAGLLATSAPAQQPAPTPAVEVPAMTCPSPGGLPVDRGGAEMGRFQKRVDDYKVCVNEYTKATGAKANEYAAQSRAYAEASNKAIDDYNAYVTGLNEASKAGKAGSAK